MSNGRTLADALIHQQRARKLNQSQAAAEIGVDRSVYSRWVSGRGAMPSLTHFAAVARFLKISERELSTMFPPGHQIRTGKVATTSQLQDVLVELGELRAEVARLTGVVDDIIKRLRRREG